LCRDLWEYDFSLDTWTQKTSFPGTGRYYAVGFNCGYLGYAGTGLDSNSYRRDFYQYNTLTDTWLPFTSLPGVSRKGSSAAVVQGTAYVLTGIDSSNARLNDHWSIQLPAGVKEQNDLPFSAFPNPVRDILNLSLPQNASGGELFIYSADGKLAAEGDINGTFVLIDLSGLQTGIYFLKIKCGEGCGVKKLVKVN
jgi:hypothetical protein